MQTFVHVKPAPGRDCPVPEDGGRLLPAEGRPVVLNAWWQRRLNDGDVIRPEDLPAAETKPAKGGKA
ncbi:DUF2635 domain-containing protein [Pseudomonas sp. 8(2025)]|uniref:DUF2635 domain-containing protein n=1 Tax=Pseudomonas sp. 8(2025) TaxID=3456022 RepID=UPI004044C7E4